MYGILHIFFVITYDSNVYITFESFKYRKRKLVLKKSISIVLVIQIEIRFCF